ncbi:MAG: ABC transporter substrate-binding protein [Synergistaceae bacterium]|jgi:multiple sugar transport system substrate-binding protein/sn-glycerol 3-phosphate transport system substrate-binding protein|nr:ABC transporter substrate-binding protein [Synergistaceae bacterium]
MNKAMGKLAAVLFLLVVLSAGEAAESKRTVVEYWHPNAEAQGGLVVAELVADFNSRSKTTEVRERFIPDMYKGVMQNLQAEAAAGKAPAIVQIGWAFLDYFSNNFIYTNPQTVIDKYFPEDATFIADNFLPNITALSTGGNGDLLGLPYSLSSPVLYLNRDMLRAAGLPENGPDTWESLREFASIIKERTGKYGLYVQEPADSWAQQAIVESAGGKFITFENGRARASFASDEGIRAFGVYADMVLKDKSALHITWDEGVQSFIDGNVGMLYTTIARRASIQKGAKFDVGAVGSPAWQGHTKKLPAGGCFLAITARSDEEKKSAWEFMRFLYSVESVAAWTKGTGYVPPREGVADAPNGLKSFLAENRMMEAATTQMPYVARWASFPGDAGLQAEQALLDMRDVILGGSESARDAMTRTQDEINQLLQ